jgi:hypothetical protein
VPTFFIGDSMSKELEDQTNKAFNFIQKLYFEASYLIKEVEGILQSEDEQFVIGRPSGYAVTTRTSTGLEPSNVELWLPKAFTVFFCPMEKTKIEKGQTLTIISDSLRLLVLDIELHGKNLNAPRALIGCISNIKCKKLSHVKKFEQLMWEFAYNRKKIYATIPKVEYEDINLSFTGRFLEKALFSINNSDDVLNKLVTPMLKLFREGAK